MHSMVALPIVDLLREFRRHFWHPQHRTIIWRKIIAQNIAHLLFACEDSGNQNKRHSKVIHPPPPPPRCRILRLHTESAAPDCVPPCHSVNQRDSLNTIAQVWCFEAAKYKNDGASGRREKSMTMPTVTRAAQRRKYKRPLVILTL